MKTMSIPLSRGKFTIVDEEDFNRFGHLKWSLCGGRGKGGFYAGRGGNGTTIYLHRLINNPPRGYETDHINHDTLDNRRVNLRSVRRSQNNENRSVLNSTSSTRKSCVYYHRQKRRFRVRITVEQREQSFGYYKTLEEASAVAERVLEQRRLGLPLRPPGATP